MAGSKGEMLMPLSRTGAWGALGSFARSSGPSAFSGQPEVRVFSFQTSLPIFPRPQLPDPSWILTLTIPFLSVCHFLLVSAYPKTNIASLPVMSQSLALPTSTTEIRLAATIWKSEFDKWLMFRNTLTCCLGREIITVSLFRTHGALTWACLPGMQCDRACMPELITTLTLSANGAGASHLHCATQTLLECRTRAG